MRRPPPIDLRSGEVLAAVTAEGDPVQGCRTIAIGSLRYAACASPQFIARHFPEGVTGSALGSAPSLRFNRHDTLQERWASETHRIRLEGPMHRVPSASAFIDFTLEGIGWSMHPLRLAEPHLAGGSLVELSAGKVIDVPLYWTVTRLHAVPLSQLTEAVREAAHGALIN